MFLMYVDESGDSGLNRSPTRYFVLSGVVIHELRWNECLERLIAFRRRMKATFGLLLREEIHAAHMINNPGELVRISRNDRLTILRHFADEMTGLTDMNIINVVVDKQGKPEDYDVVENAWRALVQRFSNTMTHRNFRGPANADERGMILPDMSEVKKISQTIRKMRRYNPIPNQAPQGIEISLLRILSRILFLRTQDILISRRPPILRPSCCIRNPRRRLTRERKGYPRIFHVSGRFYAESLPARTRMA